MQAFLSEVFWTLFDSATMVLVPLPIFVLLGLLVKGKQVLADANRAFPEIRTNLLIYFGDALVIAPAITVLTVAMSGVFSRYQLYLVSPDFWTGYSPWVAAICAVILGDFIGYWRHRIEHMPLFWPSHAVHHSDTEMTWLAIYRFHPFNRLTTVALDYGFLLMMGLPPSAVIVNAIVRHYYGAYIHADLPWTYGPLGKVFVSPAMHRWHHSMDKVAYNTNYATVFSAYDWLFGTYRLPGVCDTPLGVPQDMGVGVVGQLTYPLKPSSYRYFVRRVRSLVSRA